MYAKIKAFVLANPLLVEVVGWIFAGIFLGAGLAQCAHAADATVSWTMPTQNTDGTAIPATGDGSIASTQLQWGSCAGAAVGTVLGTTTVAAPATSATIPSLAPATYCFAAAVTNTFGSQSAFTPAVSDTIPAPVPNPPVLSTTIKLAYEIWYWKGQPMLGRSVGTQPIGTACLDQSYSLNGITYYQVPIASVTLTKHPKSYPIVVSRCSAA